MSEINLFNRWTVKKSTFWISLAAVSIILIVVLFIGSIFLSFGGYGFGGNNENMAVGDYDMVEESFAYPAEAPAMDGNFMDSDDSAGIAFNEAESDFKRVDQAASVSPQSVQTDRIIIKEGNISLEVEDTRDSRAAITAIVEGMKDQGAFIINSFETQNYEGAAPYISMVIRVPFEDFERVMEAIARMGIEINQRNEFSDDVTSEYVDLGNRIEAYEIARERLIDIMRDADTTEDLLFAEQKLTEREAELESLKGRLKYLSESAMLSRISISLSPHVSSQPIDYSWKPANTLRNAFDDLVDSLKNFADFLIIFSVAVLPWLLFFGLILWAVVRFFKRRAAKKIVRTEDKKK